VYGYSGAVDDSTTGTSRGGSAGPVGRTRGPAPQRAPRGPRREVANREAPERIPVRPQGDIPVIVRVVWLDGSEEWRPARAVRWTAEHVMVAWRDEPDDPRSERHEWLRAGDVARSVSWFVGPPQAPRVSARA